MSSKSSINNSKKPIKHSVKDYYLTKTLSEIQFEELYKKLKPAKSKKQCFNLNDSFKKYLKWGSTFVASFIFSFFIFGYLHTPNIVLSAYADIYKDSTLDNGMQSAMLQWLQENNIANVPQQYPVEMSKFCRLNTTLTTHLRIAGYKQGIMNVFFHQGIAPADWFNNTGIVDDMNWKLVKVRNNLTVIVLYSFDMREKSVLYVLDKMLPELEV